MDPAENKQLMRSVYAELAIGNSQPLLETLAEDIRWTVIGTTKFSRTFEGKQAVINELLAPLRSQIEGRIKVAAHRVLADGDYVVVEARGQASTKAGTRYDNTYCWVYRMADGKVQEATEYVDTELVTAAFGR